MSFSFRIFYSIQSIYLKTETEICHLLNILHFFFEKMIKIDFYP